MHDPAIGRFMVVDPLAEDFYYNSPYAFSENKVIAHVELEGLEAFPITFGARMEGMKQLGKKVATFTDANDYSIMATGKNVDGTEADTYDKIGVVAGAFIPVVGGKVIAKGLKKLDGVIGIFTKKTDDAIDATRNRVKLRKSTKEQILDDAPKTNDRDFIDPNTGETVPKDGPYDIGHKKGQEWSRRKKMHQEKGSTRKEVIEAENDPNLYQVEDPSSNRSRKYEKKD
jgi:hypothetical protein